MIKGFETAGNIIIIIARLAVENYVNCRNRKTVPRAEEVDPMFGGKKLNYVQDQKAID